MAAHAPETVYEGGRFFESPRWHEGHWWLSDSYDHRVLTLTDDGRVDTVMEVEGQPSGLGWMPDGSMLDAEGHVWAADALFGRCIRIAPGGAVVDEIAAPGGLGMFACMLGGHDGRDLLVCAVRDFFEHNRVHARDGVLLRTRVDVPHAGLP